jgi:mannose-6-phosphate isomerase-like protein (cupin superfamily)
MNPDLAGPGSDEVAARRRTATMVWVRIDRWDVRRDGPLSETALMQKIESLGYDVAPRAYPAGSIAALQSDSRQRLFAVVRGLIKVTIDGESAILAAGDVVYIPRGSVRRVEVVGTFPALCLEAVYRT